MPRYKVLRTTAEKRLETSNKRRLYNRFEWQDPFPEIHGTSIEKMIYARLILMGVNFIYQGNLTVAIPELNIFKDYRPDFMLPDVKIVIDPFGSYWHSSPQAVEADSYKFALFQAMGWKVVVWWDYDIETNLDALFASVPELNRYTAPRVMYKGTNLPRNVNQVDDLKGLRTMNSRKRKPYRTFIGASKKSSRKVKSSYATR